MNKTELIGLSLTVGVSSLVLFVFCKLILAIRADMIERRKTAKRYPSAVEKR